MAKPDPALLDLARYPFTCTIEPRFGDLDINMHVNNVAMAGILEDARIRLGRQTDYRSLLPGSTTMVASIAIEYIGEANYPDPINVSAALERIGRTSQQIVQVGTQKGKPLVFARTVLVMVGPDGPVPFPESFAASVEPWMLRP
ncbi:acyl-CoA thioesterase [Novosphingobium album (ex Hu et al. 2023)]|uniref:Acyl-CoA thioesterase n=1 Tax=Novosphingobium album (ex Hu et al. 2023) TaxID=2930093 RepID=A0ABT0B4T1_9SPHN|nr:acyl-CoA thioesterase [Novosphingobium album (ex Hu et al. 2023)]MCJ2179896.1 acyl-CoA thioesterase [Novosphingobium album (ex Hu et al. 2023)]